MRPQPLPPGPGQESVWDYPRPPRLEDTSRHIQVVFNGIVIADTRRARRVLETSHPPIYYISPDDIQMQYLKPTSRSSMCEWKGSASYYAVTVAGKSAPDAAWTYRRPTPAFVTIRDYVAFYPQVMDSCTVDGEQVTPQPGEFYGGWITRDVVGPFKGEPGSWGW
jgi:uncharacterized protein (DUF427 family)